MKVEAIAEICHEANRAYARLIGESPTAPWADLPESLKAGYLQAVMLGLQGAFPQQAHEAWAAQRAAEGWVYGPEIDREAKEHPALVPWAALPNTQRQKDELFIAIVRAFQE